MKIEFGSESGYIGFAGKVGFGIFSREDLLSTNYSCIAWTDYAPEYLWDSAYKAAVTFGVFANVCALAGFVMTNFLFCFNFNNIGIMLTAIVFALAFLWHTLIYVTFAYDVCNNYSCKFSTAAGVNIAAIIFMLITAYLVKKIPPASINQDAERPIPQQTTIKNTETIGPDGTKTVRKETTNPDGTVTVVETVIKPEEPADVATPDKPDSLEA
jgi:hypothetical protein